MRCAPRSKFKAKETSFPLTNAHVMDGRGCGQFHQVTEQARAPFIIKLSVTVTPAVCTPHKKCHIPRLIHAMPPAKYFGYRRPWLWWVTACFATLQNSQFSHVHCIFLCSWQFLWSLATFEIAATITVAVKAYQPITQEHSSRVVWFIKRWKAS